MRQPLALAIQEKRAETGETVEALAFRFGVKQPTVSRWANGKALPSDESLDPLADWLGVTRAEVVQMLHVSPPESENEPYIAVGELVRITSDLIASVRSIHETSRKSHSRGGGDEWAVPLYGLASRVNELVALINDAGLPEAPTLSAECEAVWEQADLDRRFQRVRTRVGRDHLKAAAQSGDTSEPLDLDATTTSRRPPPDDPE